MPQHVMLEGEAIEIVKTNRKGSIGLKVEPNRIALMIPKQFSDLTLASILENERDWLLKQIRKQQAGLPTRWGLASGQTVLWFGEPILFELDETTPVSSLHFVLDGKVLKAFCHTRRALKSPEKTLQRKCAAFYSDALRTYLTEKLPLFAEQIGVRFTEVTLRDYKARWGSCYPDGRIQFNWRLAMAPHEVIDYVAIHELCHLVHPNHSAAFWALVETHDPLFRQRKAWLKQYGTALIHFMRD